MQEFTGKKVILQNSLGEYLIPYTGETQNNAGGDGSSLPSDIPYVVEEGTYANNSNYWRLWSSGWVEQWVYISNRISGKASALKYMKPNYWVMALPIKNEADTAEEKAQPDSIWITKRYSDNKTFDYAWSGGSETDAVCFYICGWIDD